MKNEVSQLAEEDGRKLSPFCNALLEFALYHYKRAGSVRQLLGAVTADGVGTPAEIERERLVLPPERGHRRRQNAVAAKPPKKITKLD